MKWRSVSLALPSLVLLLSSSAMAQTDDQRSGARAAATAGAQAFMERRWSESVDMFSRAESLVHSPVHLLYIARAYEKLNALVKSRETYIRITNEDLPANAPQPLRDAKADAEKELDALEPRVPYVSVVVQGAGPKPVTVTMDGVQVPPALLGVPRPVDPGEHRFEARAEGMDAAASSIAVRERRSETVVLTLTPAAPGAAPAPVPAVAPAAAPGSAAAPPPAAPPPPAAAPGAAPGGLAAAPPPPQADTGRTGPSPVTWVAFGVGAIGLGVGTVFLLQSNSKVSDANSLCGGSVCPGDKKDQINSLDDDARSARTISMVGFIAGGVGVAAGVGLFVATKKKKETASTTTLTPWVGLGSAGMSGRF